jgi:hypothetical protein
MDLLRTVPKRRSLRALGVCPVEVGFRLPPRALGSTFVCNLDEILAGDFTVHLSPILLPSKCVIPFFHIPHGFIWVVLLFHQPVRQSTPPTCVDNTQHSIASLYLPRISKQRTGTPQRITPILVALVPACLIGVGKSEGPRCKGILEKSAASTVRGRVPSPMEHTPALGRYCTSRLERVMDLGENRIEMRIPRSARFLRDLRFPHS